MLKKCFSPFSISSGMPMVLFFYCEGVLSVSSLSAETMKKGTSSLNPNAAPYVPLSRRAAADANNDSSLTGNRSSNESAWLGPRFVDTAQNQNQNQSRDSQSYIAYGTPALGNYTPMVRASCGSSSANSQEMIPIDEMDLAYLQMQFPNVRYEALSDMYWANEGNLEVTVSMLNHYRLPPEDLSTTRRTPEIVEMDDVPESGSSDDRASLREEEEAAGKAASSSSGSAK